MKAIYCGFVFCFFLCFASGCSDGKLSRRQATNQINAMLKPHPVGPHKVMVDQVPGFVLAEGDRLDPPYFTLDVHKEYGELAGSSDGPSLNWTDYTVDTLEKLGYVTVEQNGPMTDPKYPSLHYLHSRTVKLTPKVGSVSGVAYSKSYDSGFSCYPQPDYHQCSLPPLVEIEKGFEITGIVQDETHAKVNLSIPWKLTSFGIALKPYAAQIEAEEVKRGDKSEYSSMASLYGWEHYLTSHANSGTSPATILFQKFDDGWRIVDEDGKSEKDFQ